MFRKLRAYRAPMAVLLVAVLLGAMFSIQIISSNSRSLGYSVTVTVEGLAPGEETQVALTRSSNTRYGMTQNGVAVVEDLLPGTYTVYTDPNNDQQMAVSTIHVPTQQSVTLQMSPLYWISVSVIGSNANDANSAALYTNGTLSSNSTVLLRNGRASIQAPAGDHRVEIYNLAGAKIGEQDVRIVNSDVDAVIVLGNAPSTRNDLTVRVQQSNAAAAASLTLYDTNAHIVYEAQVTNGVAQFYDLKSGRYLIEAQGDGTQTGAYATVTIPTSNSVTLNLTPLRSVTVDVTGSRASRASYINYSYGSHRFYNPHEVLSGRTDTISLPSGSYTVHLYDSNKRILENQSFRVSDRDLTVTVRSNSSGSTGGSSYNYSTSSNRWRTTTPSSARTPDAIGILSSSKAESAARDALAEAKRAGSNTVTVRLKDVESATRTNLRKLAENAGDRPVLLHADSMNRGKVDVRIILNPAAADRELGLRASTNSTRTATLQNKFEKWYQNRIRVIEVSQKDAWGQTVQIAAQVDLDKFDTGNLCLYTFNSSTNSYKRIPQPGYWIDSKGYLHFKTETGGDIIISNGPLRK